MNCIGWMIQCGLALVGKSAHLKVGIYSVLRDDQKMELQGIKVAAWVKEMIARRYPKLL